jgi:hypothetical protein
MIHFAMWIVSGHGDPFFLNYFSDVISALSFHPDIKMELFSLIVLCFAGWLLCLVAPVF